MAKLNARGRSELARVTTLDAQNGNKTTLALMSDGAILTKTDFYDDATGMRNHGTGWKKYGRIVKGLALTHETVQKWIEHKRQEGYKHA